MKFILFLLLFPTFYIMSNDLPNFSEQPCKVEKPRLSKFIHNGLDLRKLSAKELRNLAKASYRKDGLKEAIQIQFWASEKDGDEGLYDLACYFSLNNQVDEAVYYLQQAALKEGVKYSWAMNDHDLIPVMNSKHWDKLRPWLKDCNEKWEKSSFYRLTKVIPKLKSEKILIAFHGYGSKPDDFTELKEDQHFADKHSTTILSISASVPWGKKSFSWSENIQKDFKHIDRILRAEGYQLDSIDQTVYLIGFSQGAQLATEILARYPDVIKGIISLCPGGKKAAQLEALEPNLKAKKAVIISGSEESKANIQRAIDNKKWLESKGALVRYKIYKGMGHYFPESYYQDLNEWLNFLDSK